jgi:hypothetical protein
MRIKHAHSSSLYSASAQSLAKQVDRMTDDVGPKATVLTFTEVGSKEREDVLRKANPAEYGSWQPDITDVAVMWSKDLFTPGEREAYKLTDLVWTDGHGRKHTTYCGSILLTHKSGQRLWVSVCHTPSHVQNGNQYYDNPQARAWKDAMKGWGAYWEVQRKKHKPHLGMIVADWNVDFHNKVWRDRVQAFFPKLRLCWTNNMPQGGTHGKRLIDGTMATRLSKKSSLLQDDASSDHRPYGSIYVVPAKKPAKKA